jgi:hypothetical protein
VLACLATSFGNMFRRTEFRLYSRIASDGNAVYNSLVCSHRIEAVVGCVMEVASATDVYGRKRVTVAEDM